MPNEASRSAPTDVGTETQPLAPRSGHPGCRECWEGITLPPGGHDEPAPDAARRPTWRSHGRDLRIDLLRGYFVVAMIIDHVRGQSPLYLLTGGNRFYTSAAEGFILTSGLVAGPGLPAAHRAHRPRRSRSYKLLQRAAIPLPAHRGRHTGLPARVGGPLPALGPGRGPVGSTGRGGQHSHSAPHVLPDRRDAALHGLFIFVPLAFVLMERGKDSDRAGRLLAPLGVSTSSSPTTRRCRGRSPATTCSTFRPGRCSSFRPCAGLSQ